MDEDEIYTIELNKEQLKIISDCLEMSSRMIVGQLRVSNIYPMQDIIYKNSLYEKKEDVEYHLKEIKKILFPELHRDESYGIGKIEEADHLYEMYKEINHLLQKEREENEGASTNVHSGIPLKLTDNPLIVVKNSLELTRNNRINSLLDNED
jgi:hypothetical protein